MNDKFEKALNNFVLVKESRNSKFEKLDNWLEKESILYKSELKEKINLILNLREVQ